MISSRVCQDDALDAIHSKKGISTIDKILSNTYSDGSIPMLRSSLVFYDKNSDRIDKAIAACFGGKSYCSKSTEAVYVRRIINCYEFLIEGLSLSSENVFSFQNGLEVFYVFRSEFGFKNDCGCKIKIGCCCSIGNLVMRYMDIVSKSNQSRLDIEKIVFVKDSFEFEKGVKHALNPCVGKCPNSRFKEFTNIGYGLVCVAVYSVISKLNVGLASRRKCRSDFESALGFVKPELYVY